MQVKNDAAEPHRCLKVLSSIWKESSVHLRSAALCMFSGHNNMYTHEYANSTVSSLNRASKSIGPETVKWKHTIIAL